MNLFTVACICTLMHTHTQQRDGPSSGLPASRKYKAVMGTDGDLRKLKLPKARNVLRNFGVPEEEVRNALTCSILQPGEGGRGPSSCD